MEWGKNARVFKNLSLKQFFFFFFFLNRKNMSTMVRRPSSMRLDRNTTRKWQSGLEKRILCERVLRVLYRFAEIMFHIIAVTV